MRYNTQLVCVESVSVCFTDTTRTPPIFSLQLMYPKWENTDVCRSTWKRDIEIKCWNSLSSKCRTITIIKLADSCLLVSREICEAGSVTVRACVRVCVEPHNDLGPKQTYVTRHDELHTWQQRSLQHIQKIWFESIIKYLNTNVGQ